MPTIASPRFYVYILVRPNGKPFYVGKGTGRRVFAHDSEARRGCPCYKCKVIRKVWRQGGVIQRYLVFETDDEAEAYQHEIDLIALFDITTLTNASHGGLGGKSTPETRAKQSAALRAYLAAHPEARKQRSLALSGRVVPSSARAKNSETKKKLWKDPEYRAKVVAGLKEGWKHRRANKPVTEETRAKLSQAGKAFSQTEEGRKSHQDVARQRAEQRWAKAKADAEAKASTPKKEAWRRRKPDQDN